MIRIQRSALVAVAVPLYEALESLSQHLTVRRCSPDELLFPESLFGASNFTGWR